MPSAPLVRLGSENSEPESTFFTLTVNSTASKNLFSADIHDRSDVVFAEGEIDVEPGEGAASAEYNLTSTSATMHYAEESDTYVFNIRTKLPGAPKHRLHISAAQLEALVS